MSSTLADLEIATFAVDEVVEGTQTGWSDGRLTLALPQLAVGAGDPALAEATVEVVRPGDSVRISNVLDVALPNARVEAALGMLLAFLVEFGGRHQCARTFLICLKCCLACFTAALMRARCLLSRGIDGSWPTSK